MQEGQNNPVQPAVVQTFNVQPQPSVQPQVAPPSDPAAISWTASEFIAHAKSSGWYLVVLIATGLLAVGAFFLIDIFSATIILIIGILFCVVAARKPRELPYVVSSQGIQVDNKMYNYAEFKSFSIVQEQGIESIWFMPLKRLNPGLSIYFSPDEGQKIVDAISNYLPVEQRELDLFDSLMHRIGF